MKFSSNVVKWSSVLLLVSAVVWMVLYGDGCKTTVDNEDTATGLMMERVIFFVDESSDEELENPPGNPPEEYKK